MLSVELLKVVAETPLVDVGVSCVEAVEEPLAPEPDAEVDDEAVPCR